MLSITNSLDDSYREYKSTIRLDKDLIDCDKCKKTISRKTQVLKYGHKI